MKDEYKTKKQLIDELNEMRQIVSEYRKNNANQELQNEITNRKQPKVALFQPEKIFSKAFCCNPDIMTIMTLKEGRYIEVNDTFVKITGYERHEVIGHTVHELGIWAIPGELNDMQEKIQEKRKILGFEYKFRKKDGEILNLCLSADIVDIDGETLIIASSRDITESKRMEEALRLSEERFSKAFNASPIPMTITTVEEGRFIDTNDSFNNMCGSTREKVLGKTSLDIFWLNTSDRNLVTQKILENGSVRDIEISFDKLGEVRLGLLSAELLNIMDTLYILCILSDITELRKMEAEITRLDRLNLVGEMAASIGHEIRNPMTTVRGYLQILRENKDYYKEIEHFDLMIEEMDRANSIITEFLSLAKNKMVELKTENLNSIISKLLPLIQTKAIGSDQNIKLELNELPEIFLNEEEIRQLILNLINNGLESMPSAGDVTIRTFIENGKVVLAVQDQGHGIDCELLDKLGTPFLTTKEHGTGLGLSICYRIANRHNAQIDIETSSTGTTFYVRFSIPIRAALVS